jgi:hypothetical protein
MNLERQLFLVFTVKVVLKKQLNKLKVPKTIIFKISDPIKHLINPLRIKDDLQKES